MSAVFANKIINDRATDHQFAAPCGFATRVGNGFLLFLDMPPNLSFYIHHHHQII